MKTLLYTVDMQYIVLFLPINQCCTCLLSDPVEDDKTTAFTDLPTDPVKLRELGDHIGMELLWTEQAIQSRKKVRAKTPLLSNTTYFLYQPCF